MVLSGNMINWTTLDAQITPHFNVKDALYLHEWNRLATLDDGVIFQRIITLCQKLEAVREILGCPMIIHSMFRSVGYNRDQNINPVNDVHTLSLAVDFDCGQILTIEQIKNKLRPQLETLGIRMEKGTTTWVHIDIRLPGPSGREFTA